MSLTKAELKLVYLAGGIALAIGLWVWWGRKTTFNGMTLPVKLSSGKTYSVDAAYNDAGF